MTKDSGTCSEMTLIVFLHLDVSLIRSLLRFSSFLHWSSPHDFPLLSGEQEEGRRGG
jgi:hypothetical protein